MKKLLILLLTIAMVMTSFTACGNNDDKETAGDDQTAQVEQGDTDTEDGTDVENADGDTDTEKGDSDQEDTDKNSGSENKEDSNTSSKPSAPKEDNKKEETPKEEAKPSAPSGSPSKIIDKIYEKKSVELPLGTTELDLSDGEMFTAVTGLADSNKVKEAAYSESMMGSQAYSLVMVRVKKSKDAADVADEMLNGINPAKWICVEADDVRVAAYDDLVMLIMVSSQFEDTVTGKEIVSAFKKVCGGSLDVSKKR
ncbi:MAG: hypothetical protein ACI4LP_01460 [Anaerovoracaceae bacterium]